MSRSGTFYLILFLAFASLIIAKSAPDSSSAVKKITKSHKVLVAMHGSYLEKQVLEILKDSLAGRGDSVVVVKLEELKNEDPNQYRITVLFDAVKSNSLSESISGYRNRLKSGSNIMVSTVYGEQWDSGKMTLDAVTEATTTLRPEEIANNILKYIDKITGKK